MYVREILKVRATTSVDAKLCKIEKIAHFTHFEKKNKIMHLCTIATVIVHLHLYLLFY